MTSLVKFFTHPGLYVWAILAVIVGAVLIFAAAAGADAPTHVSRPSTSQATSSMTSLVGHTQWALAAGHDPATVTSWAHTTADLASACTVDWAALGTAKGFQVARACTAATAAANSLAAGAASGAASIDARRTDTLTAIYAAAETAGPGYMTVPDPAAPAPPAAATPALTPTMPALPAPVRTPAVRR